MRDSYEAPFPSLGSHPNEVEFRGKHFVKCRGLVLYPVLSAGYLRLAPINSQGDVSWTGYAKLPDDPDTLDAIGDMFKQAAADLRKEGAP